ncbi:DUF4355 domain-containing protein [Enterococcus dongliensis]|uniref:DUF4355 domain-containing protein n=1 Tax=Enterococcus dongliensis TaxID=2559925 RepID=A0ABU3ESL0_9ENTE|nr:DUF4355 domain-containing protein [Enterococcus dongliensis]MDT2597853.1 DUF4355 domain-containing protein [Enterococcus dongliensis]MDT2646442.1 DUF4355 domain-containing protein [Enterococcus dongliensis]
MKKSLLMPTFPLKMNLQLFAEGGEGGSGDGSNGGASTNSQQGQQSQGDGQQPAGIDGEQGAGKTFSRDEVGKMIAAETKKARASWEKEYEAKQEEAKKLAKMNAEEKLKHQLEQKESEINELKRQQTLNEMSKEASKMLSENDLPFDDDLLSLVVSDDAEATKKATNAIIAFASKIKKQNARQTTPGEGGQFAAGEYSKKTVADLAKKNRIIK